MEVNLAALRSSGGDSSLIAQFEAQLSGLAALNRQIDTASPVALAMLRATVAASVTASTALAQQASAATSAQSAGGASLAAASAAARQTVTSFERDMYERKIFDADLHFASAEDKEAYRRREAERLAETERAKAENTPQGDLRAVNLSIDQLKDAGAHGATANPAYQSTMRGLTGARDNLAAQIAMPKQEATAAARIAANTEPSIKPEALDLPPDVLASLRGVTLSNPTDTGHGVNRIEQVQATAQGRS